ncbi:MAG TPA: hypothetical protein ENG87_04510 [Candidatus Pacearchaeota archaeon]|nr:hypothetical protein BMS3Abin17_00756 [archaeon BMS3Abin17]HDK42618.1 hypothetical protein [Candidatus Pacearchaeota archaeon]HDZ60871.1 hypothetical protein [Candidatus Pacearchaeota archaeon]
MIHKKIKKKDDKIIAVFVLFEVLIFLILILSIVMPSMGIILAGVGEDNVTLSAILQIGNSPPEFTSITINSGSSIDLTPNSTTTVIVDIIARDYNGEDDISNITAEFFDNSASFYGDGDDNNYHYTNSSCSIDTSYGDITEVNATCSFEVEYYANNATWNLTALITDNSSLSDLDSNTQTVNTLLAFALPDTIDYGEVNATAVSLEKIANVTNMGNVEVNLSLSGYAVNAGDGNAMKCTMGFVKNISIDYAKYNLTSSTPGILTLSQFEADYTNLTSNVAVKEFDLGYRQNDTDSTADAINQTYWRIYVPLGVAGSCSGNIVFGAVQAGGS